MKRYTIGVLIGNANSPHTKSLMRGIHDAAQNQNVNVIFYLGVHMAYYHEDYFDNKVDNSYDYQFNVVYDYAKLGDVDALIIAYGSLCIFLEDKCKENFLKRFEGIPYVLLEDRDQNGKGTSIISDNYNGMYQIVEHLLQVHGYRKLAFLEGPRENTDAVERKKAFIDALSKYGIPIKDDMFEIGNFSDFVEEEVNALLNRYPDMEALVCANDIMAEAAYHVCTKRGLKVGKDIAITGYDDWDIAESMTPPLTTVMQNEFDMGYTAIERAIDLCEGKEPKQLIAPVVIKIRASCGCKNISKMDFPQMPFNNDERKDIYIEGVVRVLVNKILLSNVNGEIRERVACQVREIVKSNLMIYFEGDSSKFDKKLLMSQMNELITGKYGIYISSVTLTETIGSYLRNVIQNEQNLKKITILSDILASLQQYIQSSVMKLNKDDLDDFQQDTMFIPLISRDMMNQIGNEVEFYRAPMMILSAMRAKSSYLFVLEEPIEHEYGQQWKCPEKMYLVSYHEGKKIVSYDMDMRPAITSYKGISQVISRSDVYAMSAFDLFLGEMQYGVLVTEISPTDMLLFNLASMQISIALNFHILYQKQRNMQQKLENLIEEVNEKNKILGFISEYDELTGCLNRRGFMEKTMDFIHKNIGKKAVFIIADLDHLKEINDFYGHVEGDYAIESAALILRQSLGEDIILARIGGDEFVAIILQEENCDGKTYKRRIKEADCIFNEISDKPYYVELSIGVAEFQCNPKNDINSLIKQSDEMLYDSKRTRRTSIQK